MNEQQIQHLVQEGKLPAAQVCLELVQTHISWLLLCQDYVYKIKKPLKLSFLDFSTLRKRKYYCEQELILNKRLTKDMYVEVCPVMFHKETYRLGPGQGRIIDYALVMHRMDNNREMSRLLPGGVTSKDIRKIVKQLAAFHQSAQIIMGKVTPEVLIDDFNDISQIMPFVKEHLGTTSYSLVKESISRVEQFINNQASLIAQRDKQGFTRDCHGDLHSGNIFLLEEPVLFDCIEFNTHFRQIDVLNELAFFCMDLEFSQRADLSDYFIKNYNRTFNVIRNESEEQLFLFYKLYRANVKAKVNAIKTMQAGNKHQEKSRLRLFKGYFKLFQSYFRLFEKTVNI